MSNIKLSSVFSVLNMEAIKVKLEAYYKNLLIQNDTLQCEENKEIVFSIFCAKNALNKFFNLRSAIFKAPILLPFFYTIMNFARLDGVFVYLNTDKVKTDLFLIFCLNYLVGKKFINYEFDGEIFNKLDCHDLDAFDEWISVHDKLYALELDSSNIVGDMLLNFYRDNAFNENIAFKFGCDSTQLSPKSNELLKLHFFKAFNHLSKSTRITANAWSSFGEYQTSEYLRFGKKTTFLKTKNSK